MSVPSPAPSEFLSSSGRVSTPSPLKPKPLHISLAIADRLCPYRANGVQWQEWLAGCRASGAPDQSVETDAIEARQRFELQWVQATLTSLDLGDEGLRFTQRLGDLHLGEVPCQTLLAQASQERLVFVGINTLHIAYPKLEYEISHLRIFS